MNKNFWKAALNRAIRTVAQTAIATIGTTAVIEQVNWLTVLSASALAGVLSMLTSIATGLPEVERGEGKHPPDEESCPVTVKAYDDYYDNGSPKVKDGVLLPESIPESIDKDGGEDDPD